MSLAPSTSVRLGNLRYDAHVADVSVSLSFLPAANVAKVVLPASVEIDCAPGDPATVDLDGGEGGTTVLTGTVRALRRGVLGTHALVADASAVLGAIRPGVTYERRSAADVIEALARDAGVDIGVIDIDLGLAAYVAHQGRTAAEHIARLAALGGGAAMCDAEGRLDARLRPSGTADLALRFGRELLEYRITDRAVPAAQKVFVGSGPAGRADAPDALRHSPEGLPSGAPAPGADAVRISAPLLRTPGDATTASEGATTVAAAEAQRVHARCFLLPAVRPGVVVEVQDTPDHLGAAAWFVTRVVHHLRPGQSALTEWEGTTASVDTSLLGAALAALGSLL